MSKFERLNALVDHGWLNVLSHGALSVYITYDRFADAGGECFPSLAKVAERAGFKHTSSVCKARAELIGFKLMEVVESGGGRGHSATYRVLTAKAQTSAKVELVPQQNQFQGGKQTSAKETEKLVPQRHLEHNNEHTKNIPPASASGTNGVVQADKAVERKPRKPATGSHAHVVEHWCESWKRKYGETWDFRPRDGKHVKWLLDTLVGDDVAVNRIIDRFLASSDPFIVRLKHPLGQLIAQFSRFKVPDSCGEYKPVTGYREGSRCAS